MTSPTGPGPSPAPGPQSALLVEIPEAEPVVGRFRTRLDPSAALGVPPHITVLYPFIPPAGLDDIVLGQLAGLFAGVPRFSCRLDATRWFDDRVVWLAPSDPGPFAALTRLVAEAFPAYPPYGGQFAAVTPHLTIGEGAPAADLRDAETQIRPLLPVLGQAAAVTLVTQEVSGGRFAPAASFPLG